MKAPPKISPKQIKLLEAVIEETRKVGCPPPEKRIKELMGGDTNTWVVLSVLRERGYIAQPYASGPWVPLMDPLGTRFRLALLEDADDDKAPCNDDKAPSNADSNAQEAKP